MGDGFRSIERGLYQVGGALDSLLDSLGDRRDEYIAATAKQEYDNAVVTLNEVYRGYYTSNVLQYNPENDPRWTDGDDETPGSGDPYRYWQELPRNTGEAIDAAWSELAESFTIGQSREAAELFYRDFRSQRVAEVTGVALQQDRLLKREDLTARVESAVNMGSLDLLDQVTGTYYQVDPEYAEEAKQLERDAIYRIHVRQMANALDEMPADEALKWLETAEEKDFQWTDFDGNVQEMTGEHRQQLAALQQARINREVAESQRELLEAAREQESEFLNRRRAGNASSYDLQHSPDFASWREANPDQVNGWVSLMIGEEHARADAHQQSIEAEKQRRANQAAAREQARQEAALDTATAQARAQILSGIDTGRVTSTYLAQSNDPVLQLLRAEDQEFVESWFRTLRSQEQQEARANRDPLPRQRQVASQIQLMIDSGVDTEVVLGAIGEAVKADNLTITQSEELSAAAHEHTREPILEAAAGELQTLERDGLLSAGERELVYAEFREHVFADRQLPSGEPNPNRMSQEEALGVLHNIITPYSAKAVGQVMLGAPRQGLGIIRRGRDEGGIDRAEQLLTDITEGRLRGVVDVDALGTIVAGNITQTELIREALLGGRDEDELSDREKVILNTNVEVAKMVAQHRGLYLGEQGISPTPPEVLIDPTGAPFFHDLVSDTYWMLRVVDQDERWHQWNDSLGAWEPVF